MEEACLRVEGPRGRLGIIEVLGIDTHAAPRDAAEPLWKAIAGFSGSLASIRTTEPGLVAGGGDT
ncbi:hypothetical protein OG399_23935 [Streptomyces achromogenes]